MSMKNKFDIIGIIGAGAWGTALSISIASTNVKTILWAREEKVVNSIKEARVNKAYLPNIKIPHNLIVTHNIDDLAICNALLIVCPAQFTRNISEQIKNIMSKDVPFILCSKGIEQNSLMLQSEIIEEYFPLNPISVLSGPSFADEVGKLLPASLNLACKNKKLGMQIKNIFHNSNLSISLIDDIIGAQIGGIIKNIIAIGCGIAAGLELGNNVHAALITQGLKEASMLAKAKGGNPETLLDFCGSGDMVLTCSSQQSRNFSYGFEIGQRKNIKKMQDLSHKAVEGYASAKPLYQLSQKLKNTLPLCETIYKILYESGEPKSILQVL